MTEPETSSPVTDLSPIEEAREELTLTQNWVAELRILALVQYAGGALMAGTAVYYGMHGDAPRTALSAGTALLVSAFGGFASSKASDLSREAAAQQSVILQHELNSDTY